MSQFQWAKDKLKQFDMDCQNIREEIDRLYALLAKKQEARLQFQEMVEREFGAPEQTIVMQDMRTKPQLYLDRRIEEAKRLGPATPAGRPHLDDPTLPPLGTPERKREMDRRNYQKRMDRQREGMVKKKTGEWGPRERSLRSDAGAKKRGGSTAGHPRNTPEARAANATIRDRIRNAMEHRVEPTASSDLIRAWGVTDEKEKQRVYQGMNALASKGELKQVGISERGYTYLKVNGQPHAGAEG